jgi:hypothetical protein
MLYRWAIEAQIASQPANQPASLKKKNKLTAQARY